MNISFSTTAKHSAANYLAKPEYDYLNDEAKQYIIDNITNGLRVQDPMMYPSPNIEFHGNEALVHRDKIMELLGRNETQQEATDAK